jgi:hypothetical protein
MSVVQADVREDLQKLLCVHPLLDEFDEFVCPRKRLDVRGRMLDELMTLSLLDE